MVQLIATAGPQPQHCLLKRLAQILPEPVSSRTSLPGMLTRRLGSLPVRLRGGCRVPALTRGFPAAPSRREAEACPCHALGFPFPHPGGHVAFCCVAEFLLSLLVLIDAGCYSFFFCF